LINKKSSLFNDKVMREDLLKIKDLLVKIEDRDLQMRSTAAARKLAEMTEEERRMTLMRPAEKRFFLEYKVKNPKNPWSYIKAYQKKLQEEYKSHQHA